MRAGSRRSGAAEIRPPGASLIIVMTASPHQITNREPLPRRQQRSLEESHQTALVLLASDPSVPAVPAAGNEPEIAPGRLREAARHLRRHGLIVFPCDE